MTLPNVAALATYGGAKQNAAPVEDPTTDRDAGDANKAFADAAAMTHTVMRAWVRIVGSASAPALAVVNGHEAVWGNLPAVAPTIGRTTTGDWTVTWPSSITDELGNAIALNLRCALHPNIEGDKGFASATITSPNIARVQLWNSSGTASDFAGTTIWVGVG